MELKRIYRDDSPDGVWINLKDFNPSIHCDWGDPKIEIQKIETVEIAGLQEPIASIASAKTRKKRGD